MERTLMDAGGDTAFNRPGGIPGRDRPGRSAVRAFASGLVLLGAPALLAGCDDDNGTGPMMEETTFEVRVENVSQAYDYTSTGIFNTPVGAESPGPLPPGGSYEFTFDAGPGSRVSFATMFVQSNDLFYAPRGDGITLFDEMGMAVSGDITDQIYLWDAGTELNQEPGLGTDQAPRQAGADTGPADTDSNVRMAENTFGNLPVVEDAIQVTLSHLGGTEFKIRIANVAADETLMTSDGGFAPVLLAPGAWTVGTEGDALFTEGQPDRGLGLEALAEDGAVAGLNDELEVRTGLTSPIAPGVFAVHAGSSILFLSGSVDRGEGLEALAEDGDPSGLSAAVAARADVTESGVFNTPEGASGPGPAFPGDAYVFSVTAMPGDRLSLATMLVQSNDLFFAPAEDGIALFDAGGIPQSGDITGTILLWDAGTEVNEVPGVGPNQAPRQGGADTGADENGDVRQVNDGHIYPTVDQIVRVTISPISS